MNAVIEPLKVVLRAQLGQAVGSQSIIAVIEPLEMSLRAQLGQVIGSQVMIAVIEPLEAALRAQLGRVLDLCVPELCGKPLVDVIDFELEAIR